MVAISNSVMVHVEKEMLSIDLFHIGFSLRAEPLSNKFTGTRINIHYLIHYYSEYVRSSVVKETCFVFVFLKKKDVFLLKHGSYSSFLNIFFSNLVLFYLHELKPL